MSDIRLDRPEPSLAIVTIDRAAKRNALDQAAWRDLGMAFARLRGDAASSVG